MSSAGTMKRMNSASYKYAHVSHESSAGMFEPGPVSVQSRSCTRIDINAGPTGLDQSNKNIKTEPIKTRSIYDLGPIEQNGPHCSTIEGLGIKNAFGFRLFRQVYRRTQRTESPEGKLDRDFSTFVLHASLYIICSSWREWNSRSWTSSRGVCSRAMLGLIL